MNLCSLVNIHAHFGCTAERQTGADFRMNPSHKVGEPTRPLIASRQVSTVGRSLVQVAATIPTVQSSVRSSHYAHSLSLCSLADDHSHACAKPPTREPPARSLRHAARLDPAPATFRPEGRPVTGALRQATLGKPTAFTMLSHQFKGKCE